MSLYQPKHEQQTRAGNSAITRSSGCTWTSGATGADAATGGTKDRTPDYVKSLVKPNEETNPGTPGWSMPDLDLAMKRLGVPFDVRSGRGWDAVVAAHKAGLYIVLQGDSDQFGNHTCSGSFDGDHAIGIRPGGSTTWAIDDPICATVRSETPAILKRYAQKLWPQVFFGVFTTRVPQAHESWQAVIHPIPPKKTRSFFVYRVHDHHERPLRIVDRETHSTGGTTYSVDRPLKAVRGPGWTGTPPPAGLARLNEQFPGGYVDAKFAKEIG